MRADSLASPEHPTRVGGLGLAADGTRRDRTVLAPGRDAT
jgi:hypothetical protein